MSVKPGPASEWAGVDRETKMRLAAFVCWYAWADKIVQPQERRVLENLIARLGLLGPDAAQVQGWLATPPPMETASPDNVPPELRKRFVEEAERVVMADGKLAPEEKSAILKLRQVLLGQAPPPQRR